MSARQAGIMGYLMGAISKTYLLTLDYNKKIVVYDEKLEKLISVSKNEPILIIGYTYMLYEYFLQKCNLMLDDIRSFKYDNDSSHQFYDSSILLDSTFDF